MKTLRNRTLGLASLFAAATFLATPAVVHATDYKVTVKEYSAKFICRAGEVQPTTESLDGSASASTISTRVNIHNPAFSRVTYYVKLVSAWGGIYGPFPAWLDADGATSIGCEYVNRPEMAALVNGYGFEGFLVVLGLANLDVVSVYRVENGAEVTDLDVVPVPLTSVVTWKSTWTWFINNPQGTPVLN